MKAFLMHEDKDFDLNHELPQNEAELTQDLELEKLLGAMAIDDTFLRDVARRAILASLKEPAEIVYRQSVLHDCLEQAPVVREIYAITVEAIGGERRIVRGFLRYPEARLHRSIEVLELFVGLLRKLRAIADDHTDSFQSQGFRAFFAMLLRELSDDYLHGIEMHLGELRFRHGVLISARLGKGNKGIDYVLRAPPEIKRGWRRWIPFGDGTGYTLEIADRDDSGMQALSELRGRGINLAANTLAQSAEHILGFFTMLRSELGFYVGCLNLQEQLAAKGEPWCFPEPSTLGSSMLSCRGLYDVCLSLSSNERVVGNDVRADGKLLIIITGANRGGKSTFLRSIGLAQLMTQCGMFVAANAFCADVRDAIFTHYRREEDPSMSSGKWDEELARMGVIADHVTAHGIVLFNESFAATNEREGAAIANVIIRALVEANIKVFFVTHSFELAHGLYVEGLDTALFLRAARQADGVRTFALSEGEPLPTSYGEDLYERIFGEAAARAAITPADPGPES